MFNEVLASNDEVEVENGSETKAEWNEMSMLELYK